MGNVATVYNDKRCEYLKAIGIPADMVAVLLERLVDPSMNSLFTL